MSGKKILVKMIAAAFFLTVLNAASIAIASEKKDSSHADSHSGHHGGHDSGQMSGDKHKHHGKCNMMSRADSDNDGKISKEEFMKHHEAMFEKKDSNNDGFIDKDEMRMMMKHMHGHGHSHGEKDKSDKAGHGGY